MSGRPRAVVLLSGGLDSATTLAVALERGFAAHALTLSYGQRARLEVERAAAVAAALGAAGHRVLDVDLSLLSGSALTDATVPVPRGRSGDEMASGIPSTYVPARNTVFLSLALAWAESLGAYDLFIGANAVDYSGYPDCRPEFIEGFERLARLATKAGVEGRQIRVHAPLLASSKADIVRRAVELGVDPGMTLSCYEPSPAGEPCGACDSCLLRAKGFRDAGMVDPGSGGQSSRAN
ncbi:MAG: 7-cyano-7-deazaguanine synthase QueC [bacterium]|nr:7-cyano-7-deazaguanine synthase QueC [bacterium]